MDDATFLSLLTMTVSVNRRTYNESSINTLGLPTETISENSSDVKCLIQPMTDLVEFDVRGKKEVATKIGFFATTDSIQQDDIITFSNKSYIVLGVQDAAGQQHHQEVFLKRMENG